VLALTWFNHFYLLRKPDNLSALKKMVHGKCRSDMLMFSYSLTSSRLYRTIVSLKPKDFFRYLLSLIAMLNLLLYTHYRTPASNDAAGLRQGHQEIVGNGIRMVGTATPATR
jgi:hypothetical protein